MEPSEREAVIRLLLELHGAAAIEVDHHRFGQVLGYISAISRLAAHDLRHQAGAERLHYHADRMAEYAAELEEGGGVREP